MRTALLIACASVLSARAQPVPDDLHIMHVKLAPELKQIILGADIPDFRGFFHDTRSVFAVTFDTAVVSYDSLFLQFNYGTGKDWHMGQVTPFRFTLIPISYFTLPYKGDTVIYTLHFSLQLIEDSTQYGGMAMCNGTLKGKYIKEGNRFLDLPQWKASMQVQGFYKLYSDAEMDPDKMKMFWSYERPQKKPDGSYTLKDRLDPVQADPNYAGAFMVKQVVWPTNAMFPPENWYMKP
jgi:hypothetical protein